MQLNKKEAAIDQNISNINIKVADSVALWRQSAKCVIGKGLLTKPKIMLLNESGCGIGIGAKTEVFEIMNHYADEGLSLLLVSSELEEIEAIADRNHTIFLSINTMLLLAKHVALYGILAIGITYFIVTGGIDLSVGAVVGLAGIIAGAMIQNAVTIESMGVTLYFSLPLVVLITIIYGVAVGLINGVIILAVIAIIAAILLKRTGFGWHIFAIDGNEKAAKISGLKIDNAKILVYI